MQVANFVDLDSETLCLYKLKIYMLKILLFRDLKYWYPKFVSGIKFKGQNFYVAYPIKSKTEHKSGPIFRKKLHFLSSVTATM